MSRDQNLYLNLIIIVRIKSDTLINIILIILLTLVIHSQQSLCDYGLIKHIVAVQK
jgi:hypothetical protein